MRKPRWKYQIDQSAVMSVTSLHARPTATTTTATVNSSTHATSHAALSFRIDLHTRHVFRFCWFDLNGFALVSEGGEIQVKHEYTQSWFDWRGHRARLRLAFEFVPFLHDLANGMFTFCVQMRVEVCLCVFTYSFIHGRVTLKSDETKSTRTLCFPVKHDDCIRNGSKLLEVGSEGGVCVWMA